MRKEVIGDCTLYCGDSLEIIDEISAAVTITDPPYGVNLGLQTGGARKGNEPYASIEDTPEYIRSVCVPIISKCINKFERLAFTPGNRCMWMYPQPDDVGIWYNPASTNRGKWGFSYTNAFIFYYGKDPLNVGRGMRPNSLSGACDSISHINHPCPKPLLFTKWLVGRASVENETVFDPFMGSGTTGVACVELGRKFIGIEIDTGYFELSCRRIEKATRQPDMLYEASKQVNFI